MKTCVFVLFVAFFFARVAIAGSGIVSEATETCIQCHSFIHPGIVADWRKSRMARVSPAEALRGTTLERRVSAEEVPEGLAGFAVGCAECHTLNQEDHKDTFAHAGYQVNVVVTPRDCAACHPTEVEQYHGNLMSHAHGNLNDNPVYHNLAESTNAVQVVKGLEIAYKMPDAETNADSCNYCHGTEVEVQGARTVETDFGEMELPILSGWPNQGAGRINPDGSKGSCSACHPRHQFSIEMARKPSTCSECHQGPDVPAYKVYMVSKHGNLFSSLGDQWDFNAVPWKVGEEFQAPTCASCHVSLLVSGEGEVIAERTHRMNDRIPWRIFGLIYAHPHPKSADTRVIKNKAGLPLPTELTGEPVAEYLIDEQDQDERRVAMQRVCLSCHGEGWTEGQFQRFEKTIETSNEMTLAATKVLLSAWEAGAAQGLAHGDSIFNEAIEKKWVEQWLFFANSARYASAMAGADYGVFANGRWYLSKNVQEMVEWLEFRLKGK